MRLSLAEFPITESFLRIAPHLTMTVAEFFTLRPGKNPQSNSVLRRPPLSPFLSCACRIGTVTLEATQPLSLLFKL